MLESGDLDHHDLHHDVPTVPASDQPIESAASSSAPQADSCGPDLDAQGDAEYLNFFAHVEGILPTSFFSPEDGKPFDAAALDVDDQRAVLNALQARTHDIRLAAVDARLAALKRDIAGFTAAVATIADWLGQSWDDVHPRPEGGNVDARQRTIAALDLPTVVFPLQYSPLFEARRIGTVTYRRWLVATGEARPREGDAEVGASAVAQALDEADETALAATRDQLTRLDEALRRIRAAFTAHGSAADLSTLSALVAGMRAFLSRGAQGTDASTETQDGDASLSPQPPGPAAAAGPPPASIADATLALDAIADYYGRREPSSPVLPLVRQARELVGKSFLEVVTILVPSQADKAAFQIGTDQVFDLPLGKLANLPMPADAGPMSGPEPADEPPLPDAPEPPRYRVESRPQAIALLDSVQGYFRVSEPSSPVPMLCARARAMAERDFMTLLRDVLPKAALRNVNADK